MLDLVAESARVLGFAPVVRFDGAIDTLVPPALAAHALGVLREALSNVARHAEAAAAEVTVRAGEDLSLEVVDDGRGGATAPGGGGRGLRNMASRAQELGGSSTIGSGPGGGTRLFWVVPLSDRPVRP